LSQAGGEQERSYLRGDSGKDGLTARLSERNLCSKKKYAKVLIVKKCVRNITERRQPQSLKSGISAARSTMQSHSFFAPNWCNESLAVTGQRFGGDAVRSCLRQLARHSLEFSKSRWRKDCGLLLEVPALIHEFQINTDHKRACHAFPRHWKTHNWTAHATTHPQHAD
jgi:hypothetical protein